MSVQKEFEFSLLFPDSEIIYPSKHEDMFEHWDLKIDGLKIDVKSMKRINRNDKHPTNLFNFVELQNVRGDKGWLYGEADIIAFETKNKWILVKRIELEKFISKTISHDTVKSSSDCLYKIYTRFGRNDKVTMVHNMDLVEISDKVINKF